jgi:hypothetical protein
MSDYVENVYELIFLPNNMAIETFLLKSGAMRSADWMFITRVTAWR